MLSAKWIRAYTDDVSQPVPNVTLGLALSPSTTPKLPLPHPGRAALLLEHVLYALDTEKLESMSSGRRRGGQTAGGGAIYIWIYDNKYT